MDIAKYDEVFEQAIKGYGLPAQTMKAVEECSEYINAFAKISCGRSTAQDVIDEIADVTIMMRQMALAFGKDEVEKRIKFKVERLKNRMGVFNQ